MKRAPRLVMTLAALTLSSGLLACDRSHSESAENEAAEGTEEVEAPIIAKTAPIEAAERATEIDGIATILDPAPLLQIDADIASAKIATEFSAGTLTRYRSTRSLSKQTVETAAKQAGTDATQQKLLELRLKQSWGENAPFVHDDVRQKIVAQLSEGTQSIVRMDFPDTMAGKPKSMKITPLAGGTATDVNQIWPAPSGSLSMPGISFFGLIASGPGLRPGDRARVSANASEAKPGLVIPSAALVVSESRTWCYIETAPGIYEKRPVPLENPFADGYIVTSNFKLGEKVVVRGASLLLAREADPSDVFDDDDDGPAKPRPKKANKSKSSDDPDNLTPSKPDAHLKPDGNAATTGNAFAQRNDAHRQHTVDHD